MFGAATGAILMATITHAANISLTVPMDYADGEPLAATNPIGIRIYRSTTAVPYVVADAQGLPGERLTLTTPQTYGKWFATAYHLSNELESAPSEQVNKWGGCYAFCHGD